MNLYLMRHAEAIPVGGEVVRDDDRPLSARGEHDAALVGKALVRLDPSVDVVVTSPLVRAVQTGNIVRAEFGNHAILRKSTNLSPGFNVGRLMEELITLGRGGNVVAVGHQPDLSMCISYLIAVSGAATVAMEPGAVACVKLSPRGRRSESQLRWLLTPALAATFNTQP